MNKSKERLVMEALENLFGRTPKAIISNGEIIQWMEPGEGQPTEERIQTEINRIIAEEPHRLLRMERDRRLGECDWRMTSDYPHADQQAWVIYRQSLRDLPNQIENGEVPSPTLDERGELIFEHWPIEPNS